MKYLLFGTGDYYERYKKWFEPDEVVGLIDNSPQKQGNRIDGHLVMSPVEAVKCSYDKFVILSFYVVEMKSQLLNLSVDENKICHFFDLHDVIYCKSKKREIQYYGNARKIIECEKNGTKKIVLLSHDLTLGGPALALAHMARTLKSYDYEVVVGSMLDGPLREKLLEEGFSVVIDENLQLETMNDCGWLSRFDLIVCNTISYYVFLSQRDTTIPVIWWLHDSEFFYGGVNKDRLRNISKENLTVASVGPVPRNALLKYVPDFEIVDLIYGVKAVEVVDRSECLKGKLSFVTIGYVESRKGQDILISAIHLLPQHIKERCEFLLVGQNTSLLAQKIESEIKDIPQVRMIGIVGRNDIDKILDSTDVLICPSREDPMPTVAAEAMMHYVPCIVSDVTGTAGYIQDGKNGWTFKSEDASALAEHIVWCVENKDNLDVIRQEARKLFEQYFSVEVFNDSLLELIDASI